MDLIAPFRWCRSAGRILKDSFDAIIDAAIEGLEREIERLEGRLDNQPAHSTMFEDDPFVAAIEAEREFQHSSNIAPEPSPLFPEEVLLGGLTVKTVTPKSFSRRQPYTMRVRGWDNCN